MNIMTIRRGACSEESSENVPNIYEDCVTLDFTETVADNVRPVTADNNNVLTYLDYIIIDGVEITPTKNYQHTFSLGNHKIGWKFNDSVVHANVMVSVSPLADRVNDNALVIIPSDITEIEGGAMRGIPAYYPNRGVTCYAITPPTVGTYGINSWNLNGTGGKYLRVPAGSVNVYKAADGWSQYADYIIAI